jgi:hypothetical protein
MPATLSSRQIQLLNHFFFAGVFIWFVAQQPVSWHQLASSSASGKISHALQYFPRTPPPIFEPEALDLAQDSTEPHSTGMPI